MTMREVKTSIGDDLNYYAKMSRIRAANGTLYIISIYILYLYLREILLDYKVELPGWEFLFYFDVFLLFFGGILAGIGMLLLKGTFNRCFGIAMILVNLIVGGDLIAKALK
jgi:hypothetical protein